MRREKSTLRTVAEPLVLAVALAAVIRAGIQIYSIPSSSMSPTLEPGDGIVVTPYLGRRPEPGDVVVFESPASPEEILVKRVIGVPGDLIETRMGRVRIGGYTLAEPYLRAQAATGAIDPQIVPAESYFVLGDNRSESLDSRSWGFVPESRILGRARLVLWSGNAGGHPPARASSGAETDTGSSERRPLTPCLTWIE